MTTTLMIAVLIAFVAGFMGALMLVKAGVLYLIDPPSIYEDRE